MKFDIVCIGTVSVDTVIRVPFMPSLHSESFADSVQEFHGGAAANVAAFASFYGELKTGIVSCIGSDAWGMDLVGRLRQYGVDTRGIREIKGSTSTRIFTITTSGQERAYLVSLGALRDSSTKDFPREYRESELFYVAPHTAQAHRDYVKLARELGITVALNPGSVYIQQAPLEKLHRLLKHIKFLFLNEEEAHRYAKRESTAEAGKALLKMGAEYVVVTLGARGCRSFHNGHVESISAPVTSNANSMGSGDAFAAGFLSRFLRTSDIRSSLEMGQTFGAFAASLPELRRANPDKALYHKFRSAD